MIAPGHARAPHINLARRADGNGLAVGVQQNQVEMRQRRADEAGRVGRVGSGDGPPGDMHGGLGDAVHVHQPGPPVAMPLEPGGQRGQIQRLAAEDDPAQGQINGIAAAGLGGYELAEGRRSLVEDGDAAIGQELEEGRGVAGQIAGDDLQSPAKEQRPPHLPHREVERVGVEEGPDVVGAEVEEGPGFGQKPRHIGVGDDDALGPPRGAAGVDDVSGVVGVKNDCGRCLGIGGEDVISKQ